MKILMFSGSLRRDSFNKKLLGIAKNYLQDQHEVQLVDLDSFQIPIMNPDLESSHFPAGVKSLGTLYHSADAVIISSPEYNGSISGVLKNTIDWLSRLSPHPFSKKPTLLLGASPGYYGAIRGLWATKIPFDSLGSFVYPQMFALPGVDKALMTDGKLSEPYSKNFNHLLGGFLSYASSFQSEKTQ